MAQSDSSSESLDLGSEESGQQQQQQQQQQQPAAVDVDAEESEDEDSSAGGSGEDDTSAASAVDVDAESSSAVGVDAQSSSAASAVDVDAESSSAIDVDAQSSSSDTDQAGDDDDDGDDGAGEAGGGDEAEESDEGDEEAAEEAEEEAEEESEYSPARRRFLINEAQEASETESSGGEDEEAEEAQPAQEAAKKPLAAKPKAAKQPAAPAQGAKRAKRKRGHAEQESPFIQPSKPASWDSGDEGYRSPSEEAADPGLPCDAQTLQQSAEALGRDSAALKPFLSASALWLRNRQKQRRQHRQREWQRALRTTLGLTQAQLAWLEERRHGRTRWDWLWDRVRRDFWQGASPALPLQFRRLVLLCGGVPVGASVAGLLGTDLTPDAAEHIGRRTVGLTVPVACCPGAEGVFEGADRVAILSASAQRIDDVRGADAVGGAVEADVWVSALCCPCRRGAACGELVSVRLPEWHDAAPGARPYVDGEAIVSIPGAGEVAVNFSAVPRAALAVGSWWALSLAPSTDQRGKWRLRFEGCAPLAAAEAPAEGPPPAKARRTLGFADRERQSAQSELWSRFTVAAEDGTGGRAVVALRPPEGGWWSASVPLKSLARDAAHKLHGTDVRVAIRADPAAEWTGAKKQVGWTVRRLAPEWDETQKGWRVRAQVSEGDARGAEADSIAVAAVESAERHQHAAAPKQSAQTEARKLALRRALEVVEVAVLLRRHCPGWAPDWRSLEWCIQGRSGPDASGLSAMRRHSAGAEGAASPGR